MPAPTGNTNATKWTLERTTTTLQQIEEIADQEHILHIGQALAKVRCYGGLWSYWKKLWRDNEDIMETIGYIEQLFINKIWDASLHKKLHPATCIFMLKVNYGLTDRQAKQQAPEIEEPQIPVEQQVKEQVETQMKEKLRVLHKVLDYNESHPERMIPVRTDYLDVQPPGPCIRHSGDFYSKLY